MRLKKSAFCFAAFCSLLLGATAHAASVSGTVTNKTTGKPSAGDAVTLVSPMSGMAEVAHAKTDANGHYILQEPSEGRYLIRVDHQGAGYFIEPPQSGAGADISVYDAAPKVNGISIEAEIYQLETQNDQLSVSISWVVHNSSSPKETEAGGNTFEFVLPADAVFDGAQATRPGGMATMAVPKELGKGRYAFNVPIEPDRDGKTTEFQIGFHVPYSGKYTVKPSILMPVDNLAVELPKALSFTPGSGASYQSIPQDPSLQTYLMKNVLPGKAADFTVSGTGSLPREQQQQQPEAGAQQAPQQGPGGGIGEPINTPDPLSKYKWWILGGLALLLAAAAAFLLRRPPAPVGTAAATPIAPPAAPAFPIAHAAPTTPAGKNSALLNALKEELFSLESEKISGAITPEEYAVQKAALETVLKRALTRV